MLSPQPLPSSVFSRERAAGYDPERLRQARVLVVGAGAAGSNLIQTLALSGVANIYAVDPDHIEPSNLTRSPLYIRERMQGKRKRMKAKEVGIGLRSLGIPQLPRYLYATDYIEALGLGAIADADVVAGCVDSNEVRALLADWTRLVGKPYVEVGFRGEWLNVSVFPNTTEDEPCWRCDHPHVLRASASCSLYAEQATSSGLVPAIQAAAATSASIAAEAVIQSLHGSFPMGNQRIHLNIRTGQSDKVELSRDPECPGAHKIWPKPAPLSVAAGDKVQALLDTLDTLLRDPVVEPPFPFVFKLPCKDCGKPIQLNRPVWKIRYAPKCKRCSPISQTSLTGPVVFSEIGHNEPVLNAPCQQIGLAPATVFSAYSAETNESGVFCLAGRTDDLYQELQKRQPE